MQRHFHGNRYHAVASDGAVDPDHPLNAKRVAWYYSPPGVAAAGSRLLDLCGRNHGTLNAQTPSLPIWTPGQAGVAEYAFDGSTQSVTLPSPGSSIVDMSVALWCVRPTSLKGWPWTYQAVQGILINSDGTVRVRVGSADYTSTATIPLRPLSRVLVTKIGTVVTTYLNGYAVATGTTTATTVTWSGSRLAQRGDSVEWYAGNVRDVGIWSRGLSPGEALAEAIESAQGYRSPGSPLRWASTRTWFVPATGIAFDAVSNSGIQTGVSTYSWSHTCTGTNRYLAVDVSLLSAGQTVTGITYNGVALSLISGASGSTVTSFGRVECWGLANPASGSNTIAVTLSGSVSSAGTAASYTGVHQTSPTESGNFAQATNVGAADATVTITPAADNTWVHGVIATNDTSVTANQTSRNNVTGLAGSGADEDTGPVSPAVATVVSYTNVGSLQTWAMAGYAIRPIAASSLFFGEEEYDWIYSPSLAW